MSKDESLENQEITDKKDLVLIKIDMSPEEIFQGENLNKIFSMVRSVVDSQAKGITTEKERKDLRSLAYKISRSKTAVESIGKSIIEEWSENISKINKKRNASKDFFDSLREEILLPLTKWEKKEEERVKERQVKLQQIRELRLTQDKSSEQIKIMFEELKVLNALTEEYWSEFFEIAKTEIQNTLNHLNIAINEALDKEEQDRIKEQERLQEEERKKKEHEEKIAEQARIKALKEADEKAEAERVKNENEKKRLEKEKLDAQEKLRKSEEKAKLEKEQAKKREEDLKAKLQKDKEDALKKERDDFDNKQRALKLEEQRKSQDVENRRKIHQESRDALSKASGLSEEVSQTVIALIASGKIKNVFIKY